MYYGHMHGLGWLLGGGMMILFVVALVVVVAVVLRRDAPQGPEPSARETLDRRLSSGDIEPDEYRRRRDLLAGR